MSQQIRRGVLVFSLACTLLMFGVVQAQDPKPPAADTGTHKQVTEISFVTVHPTPSSCGVARFWRWASMA
jgi:hypothetical protein